MMKHTEDKFEKAYRRRMHNVWLIVNVQIVIAALIVGMAVVNAFSRLYTDAGKTMTSVSSQMDLIVQGYKNSFNSILIPIKDKIAEDPSFDEMQTWLQSKEGEFRAGVGAEAYDGIALTYKGGYAHSWNYGDYSNYDPGTRPWYQQAQQANGEVTVVAPYVTFLTEDNQSAETTPVLMTIAQKYNDEISFDLDLKLPAIKGILQNIETQYPGERIFIYNQDGQVLSSVDESIFAHNVYTADDIITEGTVKMVNEYAKNLDVLQIGHVDGQFYFIYFAKDSGGNTLCITVPTIEVYLKDFLFVTLVCIALLAYLLFVFFKSRRSAIEFTERDKRMEVIENKIQLERLYVDTDKMVFYGNEMANRNTNNQTYESLFALIRSRLVDEKDLPRLTEFLGPDILGRNTIEKYVIERARFLMKMQDHDGSMKEKTIELGRLAFVQNKINMVEIVMTDATESVDALRAALKETEQLKEEKADEYNRFMSYICMAEDGVEELDIRNHMITRFYIKDGKLEKQTIPYPEDPFALWHKDDVPRAHELYDEDKLWALCRKHEAGYAEMRMKWYGAAEYRWCTVIVLGMPVTKKTPFNVLVLIKDIDEEKKKEFAQKKALEDAYQLAQQGSAAKGAFLSKMSHEIRTPLNAIIGYLGIAKDAQDDLEKINHCIENSEVASRHLLQIINDVLDISSIESGKMKIAHEDFSLKKEVTDITTIFYQNAKAKNQNFETHIENVTEEWVVGDQLRLNQILMNLLSNALKFTPENGSIQFTVEQLRKDDGKVYMKFIVTDTGIGMSEAYMSRIFQPFEQEQASTARKYGGSGLGLSITNNLVKMMGGKIEVHSKQNEGTTFAVMMFFDLAKGEHASLVQTDYSHVRVLVVDDKEDDCSYIKMMLKRCGAKADTVTSGAKALKKIRARHGGDYAYDLCIIDWSMPEMNGGEVTRRIRSELGETMPIIIATAYDVSECREEAKAAGADKIISKPLFQSTLFDILVTHFGAYEPESKPEEKHIDMNGIHILLAEDNAMNMEIAVTVLEKAGAKVDQARDGKEAMDMFLASAPGTYQVILMDVQMPVMDGYEATREIRKSSHPEAASIPIVAMTANAFAEDVTEALANGMTAHISKPIDKEKLFEILEKCSNP